jgi:pantoate--beta-alanine ligase
MKRLETVDALREWVRTARAAGRRIAFVPTMGALHEGHLALVDEARRRASRVVMSVFVNPLQFGPTEDYGKYPRDIERDESLAGERGVDALYTPAESVMYPPGSEVRVVPGATASRWEGAIRPGHFEGVLTVVAKLFHQVMPDLAIFGQKDIQQLTLIRRMLADLDWPIEIVMVPTVRESDGLALSSRNAYLDAEDRIRARALSAGLFAAQAAWQGGERSAEVLRALVAARLSGVPGMTPEYIAVVEPEGLSPVDSAVAGTIVAVAVRLGPTRLIDNVILEPAAGRS